MRECDGALLHTLIRGARCVQSVSVMSDQINVDHGHHNAIVPPSRSQRRMAGRKRKYKEVEADTVRALLIHVTTADTVLREFLAAWLITPCVISFSFCQIDKICTSLCACLVVFSIFSLQIQKSDSHRNIYLTVCIMQYRYEGERKRERELNNIFFFC